MSAVPFFPAPEQPAPAARPKLGLALSGGGFRAAFFHIGVLARVAERGLLRHVEVISTVSGGSIVGALYYIHVRNLLQTKERPDDVDYVTILERMEREFLRATEANIRARATAAFFKNLRMARADYSRSDRLGELYDELLYRPAWNDPLFGDPPDSPRSDPIRMRDLLVQPPGHEGPFHPDQNVDRGDTPVPVLVINATTLNTGHNWRFEAVAMGEPARDRPHWVEIDKNERYLRTPYDEGGHERHRDFTLGNAVSASACVPGLFHPLAISDLLPHGIRVELVDGGVHDNQGVCGLFDTDCSDLIVSDASGQMGDRRNPPTRIPASLSRSASIYGDRVREEQLSDARRRYGLALAHLKKGLPSRMIAPRAEGAPGGIVDYGVHPKTAELLSGLRTDLDAFSEVEAAALALYGYRMMGRELVERGHAEDKARGTWNFERLGDALASAPSGALLKSLVTSKRRFGKAASVSLTARLVGLLLMLCGAAAAIALGYWATKLPGLILVLLGIVLIALVGLYLAQEIRFKPLRRLADFIFTRISPVLLAPVLWLSAGVTLGLTPTFLKAGRLDRVLEGKRAEAGERAPAAGT
jgi:NTE family protein